MIVQQIRALASRLCKYLDEFAGCFRTRETHRHLNEYVQGQLSDLPRKSVEPIADLMDVPPRTLQEFLSFSQWDHDGLRDTVQRIVARDHAEPQAIGIIDESGHPKKGDKTACVHHQYCGASGKVDNCVMGVHLCYASFDGKFRAMLDSDLFLPEKGWDAKRRKEAGIPESLVYRPKHLIALEQLRRAAENGLHLGWVTADIWYGEKPVFIEGLEDLGLRFVLEIPKNLMGWVRQPADADVPRGEVQDLTRWSRPMVRQEWTDFHIKDTGMGALVWEVRTAPFWIKRDGEVAGPYWLIAARDRFHQDTIKYFLSNAPAGFPAELLLHVAFSRWPVERCLEDEKSELGMSDFEVRKYNGVLRHLRHDHARARRIRDAGFPVLKTLEQFDFTWPTKINRQAVQNLFRLRFVHDKACAVLVGGVGLGKSHLAVALGHAACEAGFRVRFTTAIGMVNALSAAHNAGRFAAELKKYTRPQLLLIDELGHLPVDKRGAELLFQVISERYERGAVILTTNKAFKHWPSIFNNDSGLTSALLDRVLHHSETIVIEGKSYRMKDRIEP